MPSLTLDSAPIIIFNAGYISLFTLNKDNWAKICTDTFKVNRDMYPALKIIIGAESKVRLGIIEWSILEELIQFWEENHD